MRAGSAAFFLVASLLLAACADEADKEGADDDLSAQEQAYANALATLLAGPTGFVLAADEAACMGETMMAELGVAPFAEGGVGPEDLNAEDAPGDSPGELLQDGAIGDDEVEKVVDEWEGCVDLSDVLADTFADDYEFDDEGRACVAESLDEQGLTREVFASYLTTKEDDGPSRAVFVSVVEVVDGCGGR